MLKTEIRLLDEHLLLHSLIGISFPQYTLIQEDIQRSIHLTLQMGLADSSEPDLPFISMHSSQHHSRLPHKIYPSLTSREQFKCSYLLTWNPTPRQTVPWDDLYPSFESNAPRPKKTLCPETGVATAAITSSANQLLLASTSQAIYKPWRTWNHCVSNSQRLF